MPRYEVRFYDALNHVKVSVEVDAADAHAAERAAVIYLEGLPMRRAAVTLLAVGAVRELR